MIISKLPRPQGEHLKKLDEGDWHPLYPRSAFIPVHRKGYSAGGLTEFDSSGNMSLTLASAVQIGSLVMMNTIQESINYSEYGILTFTDCGQAPLRGLTAIPPVLLEDTYFQNFTNQWKS